MRVNDNLKKIFSNCSELVNLLNAVIPFDLKNPGFLDINLQKILPESNTDPYNLENEVTVVAILCLNSYIDAQRIESLFRQNILPQFILERVFSSASADLSSVAIDMDPYTKYLTLKDLSKGIIPGDILNNDEYNASSNNTNFPETSKRELLTRTPPPTPQKYKPDYR